MIEKETKELMTNMVDALDEANGKGQEKVIILFPLTITLDQWKKDTPVVDVDRPTKAMVEMFIEMSNSVEYFKNFKEALTALSKLDE